MFTLQRQLQSPTRVLRGMGLFTGVECAIIFYPAPPGHGIRFRAPSAGPESPGTPAVAANVAECPTLPNVPCGFPVRNTTLTLAPDVYIATIEHAMSALRGLLIADCLVEVAGPEVPIFDGSALPFVQALLPLLLDVPIAPNHIILREPVTVHEGNATVTATPHASGCSYTYILDYGPNSPLPAQRATWSGDPFEFAAELAPARTFSLEREAAVANALGLFHGFTPRDLLVIGNDGQPIDNTWRFDNEPARHKLLDLIGDVTLLGRWVQADIVGERSGHTLTRKWCDAAAALAPTPPDL